VLEIEELKQALDDRSTQLKKAEREKDRIASEKDGVAKTVSSLEADLRRVRRDAEAFGRDLRMLRAEKEKLEGKLKEEVQKGERAKKQSQTQVKLLNEQLEAQKQRAVRALEVYENHVCAAYVLFFYDIYCGLDGFADLLLWLTGMASRCRT
jgi:flagellar biosynthesis chaperone FliJ